MSDSGPTFNYPNDDSLEDILAWDPKLPAVYDDASAGLQMFDFPSSDDLDKVLAAPIRYDSRYPLSPVGVVMQEHLPLVHDLATFLPPQHDSFPTTCMDPWTLQPFSPSTHRREPPALPELGGTQLPVSHRYGRWLLPPSPPFTTQRRHVLRHSSFDLLTPSALHSANSLRRFLIQSPFESEAAHYPRRWPLSEPAYADVEDLALDPEERSVYAAQVRHAEADSFAQTFTVTSSYPATLTGMSSEGVEMRPPPSLRNWGRLRYHTKGIADEGHVPRSSAINTDRAERKEQLSRAVYESNGKKRQDPLEGPILTQVVSKEPKSNQAERRQQQARQRYHLKKQQRDQQRKIVTGPITIEIGTRTKR